MAAAVGGTGGDGGIRTLDRPLQAYNGLANRRLQPLGHVSSSADMPDARAGRKRQIQAISGCALASAARDLITLWITFGSNIRRERKTPAWGLGAFRDIISYFNVLCR
jgi:hypothetical protein